MAQFSVSAGLVPTYKIYKICQFVGLKKKEVTTIVCVFLRKAPTKNMKKSFTEQRTALVNEVLNLIHNNSFEMLTVRNSKFMSTPGQAGVILNENEINNILNSLDQNKISITNNIIQLLYNKGLFDSFPNKNQAFANYLTFSEPFLKEKYGKTFSFSNTANNKQTIHVKFQRYCGLVQCV